ncbi:MAG: sugar nucleotidyltransferase [Betaproteobacteria bacterium]|nr:sugar nucleotidyltransferase [Betaproteobacteria bacterium]
MILILVRVPFERELSVRLLELVVRHVASDLKYRLFVVRRDDPRAFGVAIWRDGKVIDIIEKPAEVVSRDAVVGLYCYKPDIFPILRELKPSARGELEISDLNRRLVQDGGGDVTRLHMEWIDAGTPHQLKRANELAWRASCL